MSDPSEAHHNQAWTAYQDCDHATEFMVCDDCVAKAIAAAEERGRRAGIEEAAKCPDCGGALESFCGSDKCRDAAIKAWSLAPRDSARCPDGNPFCACQKPMDAPRDSGKET